MISAIEIHNKPAIKYRYEMVVLLVLNSWELLLKGYLYKYHKDVKVILKDGTTKPFENCLNIVNQKIGNKFNPTSENLNVLYQYRNQVAHFYIEELDPIIFSLISKNVIFYAAFLKEYFNKDISKTSDLILLPIGFKRPTSPIDYISITSYNEKASIEVKAFLKILIDATQRLNDKEIEESIFVDFRMNLINVNRITNADLIAAIDNSLTNNMALNVSKEPRKVIYSNKGEKVLVTRNRSEAQGTIYYEEIQEGIFDEINNILDANRILSHGEPKFMLGTAIYYRIYAERQHVNFNIETFDLLARTGAMEFYAPFLFWLTNLPAHKIADILFDIYSNSKSPNINNLTKIALIVGNGTLEIFKSLLEHKYKLDLQKPEFLYSFLERLKSSKINPILKALKATENQILMDTFTYGFLLKDKNVVLKLLSQECLNAFKGQSTRRGIARDLDYLAYSSSLINNLHINEEIDKRKQTIK